MLQKLKQAVVRAYHDTRTFFEWSPKQLIWPLVFVCGLVLHYLQTGKFAPAADQLQIYGLYTVAPVLGMAVLMFAWNLVCAPYRIERDRQRVARIRLQELEHLENRENHQRRIREQLGEFLGQGREIRMSCSNEDVDPPEDEANSWAADVEAFLTEELDTSYVHRFRDHSGQPVAMNSIRSIPHRKLWGGLMTRTTRLQEFIREMSD